MRKYTLEYTFSDNTLLENTVLTNTLSENTLFENTLSENTLYNSNVFCCNLQAFKCKKIWIKDCVCGEKLQISDMELGIVMWYWKDFCCIEVKLDKQTLIHSINVGDSTGAIYYFGIGKLFRFCLRIQFHLFNNQVPITLICLHYHHYPTTIITIHFGVHLVPYFVSIWNHGSLKVVGTVLQASWY